MRKGPMTDEMKDTGTAEKVDPRETPAFRGVLKQLEAERSEKAALADRLRALEDESNTRKQAAERKQLEQAGKYEEALKAEQSAWETRHAAIQQELAQAKAEYERTRVVADLAAHGVTGKARDFLASSYLSLEQKPDLNEWIEAAKVDADYGMFFTAAKTRAPQPGDVGGRAAATSGALSWDQIRANLSSPDPAIRRAADDAVRRHMESQGKLPW
jgi:multidrug efflux pump subunit AcrA (membrane-fusion protein)